MIKKAIKKPVEIEYIQYTGDNEKELIEWSKGRVNLSYDDEFNTVFGVATLEGFLEVDKDDYVVKGVHGEFYPVKPDIFEKTYDISNNKQYLWLLENTNVINHYDKNKNVVKTTRNNRYVFSSLDLKLVNYAKDMLNTSKLEITGYPILTNIPKEVKYNYECIVTFRKNKDDKIFVYTVSDVNVNPILVDEKEEKNSTVRTKLLTSNDKEVIASFIILSSDNPHEDTSSIVDNLIDNINKDLKEGKEPSKFLDNMYLEERE